MEKNSTRSVGLRPTDFWQGPNKKVRRHTGIISPECLAGYARCSLLPWTNRKSFQPPTLNNRTVWWSLWNVEILWHLWCKIGFWLPHKMVFGLCYYFSLLLIPRFRTILSVSVQSPEFNLERWFQALVNIWDWVQKKDRVKDDKSAWGNMIY